MRFIAFDLETTGTVPGVDQIVEIGAVRFINGQPEAVFATLIDPQRPIPPGASAVNGISDDMVKGKPTVDTILESFAEFCGDDILVAHNAPFDAQFLTADIKKFESSAPTGIILDTLPIARKVFPGLPNYKLGTLVQHLKIPTTDFHRAEEDASYCGHLFFQMTKRISIGGQAPQNRKPCCPDWKTRIPFPTNHTPAKTNGPFRRDVNHLRLVDIKRASNQYLNFKITPQRDEQLDNDVLVQMSDLKLSESAQPASV